MQSNLKMNSLESIQDQLVAIWQSFDSVTWPLKKILRLSYKVPHRYPITFQRCHKITFLKIVLYFKYVFIFVTVLYELYFFISLLYLLLFGIIT